MNEVGTYFLVLGGAAFLGGAIGLERELCGGWAGLRTHMMVAMAAAMFVEVGLASSDASSADLSRILQGITAGIGFIGAGTILKLTSRLEIKGLTTASSIWLAAAVGAACGVRLFLLASVATLLSVFVLYVLRRLESRFPVHFKQPNISGNDEGDMRNGARRSEENAIGRSGRHTS